MNLTRLKPSLVGFILLLVPYVTSGSCADHINVTITNLTVKTNFDVNRQNLSDYNLTITYSWSIEKTTRDAGLDGFIYCFHDADEKSSTQFVKRSIANPSPDGPQDKNFPFGLPQFFDPFPTNTGNLPCGNLESYWVTGADGIYQECIFPCSEQLGQSCISTTQSSAVCNLVSESCKAVTKDTRDLVLAVKFGRKYSFEVHPYVGLYVKKSNKRQWDGYSLFCGDHLIDKLNISHVIAYEFCRQEQTISSLSTASGKASNFSIDKIEDDLTKHKAVATVRWHAPHDVALDKRVTSYIFSAHGAGTTIPKSPIKAKSPEEEKTNPYYYVTVADLDYNRSYSFSLTPDVNHNETCHRTIECEKLGLRSELNFTIKDIDACSRKNGLAYCHSIATCVDARPGQPFPANCSCPVGYDGNGISLNAGGTGCSNFNACKSRGVTEKTCSAIAECIDDDPPSMGVTCRCPSSHIGDGLRSGSGCTELRLLVLLSVGIPLGIIFVVAGFLAVWKYRLFKKKTLDLALSKFVSRKNYTAPLVIGNGMTTNVSRDFKAQTAFGERWELNRDDLTLQGVVGRGNFGIVHRATLKRAGEEKVVAVKSLAVAFMTRAYIGFLAGFSPEKREEFLAEMSLLISLGHHDNVLGVVGVCTSQSIGTDDTPSPLLVTPFMTYGDLLHFLWDSREESMRRENPVYDFTEISLYKCARQVASGLQFISTSRIIHGDVAARNILVGDDLQCKISDFGLANDVYRYGLIKSATERRVPFKWISPERMMGGLSPITWRSDVWSLGVLLYEMVTLGSIPYPGMDAVTIFHKLKSGYRMPRPSSCNEYLYEIMTDCWHWEALKRPSFKMLEEKFSNPFMSRTRRNSAYFPTPQPLNDAERETYLADIGRRDENLASFSDSNTSAYPTTDGAVLQNGHAVTEVESRESPVPSTSNILSARNLAQLELDNILCAGDIAVSLEVESSREASDSSDLVVPV
ncbi:uncharacterized protein LOC143470806 isoform X2 [Clavelina lepadiformis]|uniref:uncharacterized protein LOC143470806 isoform X2 n=1 Tax=Clavelina lepadiformis TaxID=159417 RepID=UPI004041DB65